MAGKVGRPPGDGKGRHGGRQPGSKNKIGKFAKEMIQKFLDDNAEVAWACWDEIENPKDKFNAFLKVAEFVLPKMASVEVKGDKEIPDWMKKLDEIRGNK
jgi:hypothetical protein